MLGVRLLQYVVFLKKRRERLFSPYLMKFGLSMLVDYFLFQICQADRLLMNVVLIICPILIGFLE